MDINRVSFYPLILDILEDISESHFVAIDLELSGVPSKDSYAANSGRPSLQQRYIETKEAAERYQILQIGLTCVEQDLDHGKYILKPYNFDLSPVIHERGLDIERIFSFQSGAAEFLLKVGFDMNRPFKHGVPYLSRTESRVARQKHARRQDRSALADIQIKPTETDSLAFLERVRGEVRTWLATKSFMPLEIRPLGVKEHEIPDDMSRFEKRLVHQLVRSEFPELVSISKRGLVQIDHFNKEREDRIASQRERELEERINRQKGFRWLVEALGGGNITGFDFKDVARDSRTGDPIFADLDQYKAQLNRAQGRIRGNPRVLVGHNCFLDMVYIYRTFIGDLPETVEAFQSRLHDVWPVIVDTKYMSTHNCGDINPVSSLEQIAQQLNSERTPKLETDEHHRKYDEVEALHEAGYDSFLTAQVAIRLSAKLESNGVYVDVPVRPGHTDRNREDATNTGLTPDGPIHDPALAPSRDEQQNASRSEADGLGAASNSRSNARERKRRFRDPKANKTFEGGMPRFNGDFWRVYGNKMRVFGTEESVCVLDTHTSFPDSEDGGVGV